MSDINYKDFDPISFGEVLKLFRENSSYTVQEILDGIEIHRSAYYALESGKSSPSISTILKIANFYDVSLESLLEMMEMIAGGIIVDVNKFKGKVDDSLEDGLINVCLNNNVSKKASLEISKEVLNYLNYLIDKNYKVSTPKVHNYLTDSNLFD